MNKTTRKTIIKSLLAACAIACAGFTQRAEAAAIGASTGYADYIYVQMAAVSGATSYQLYRSTSPSFSTASRVYSGSARNVRDWTAALGRRYYYWRGYTKGGRMYYTTSYDYGWRKMTLTTFTVATKASRGTKVWLNAMLNGKALSAQNVSWTLSKGGVHRWTKYRYLNYLGYFSSAKKGTGTWKLKVGEGVTLKHDGKIIWK